MINIYQPCLGKEEVEAVSKVFESNWLGKGKLTAKFEADFAAYRGVEAEHMLSTNCCSEGLFSSMHIFNIGPGDEVIVPTTSFVGAANAVKACGADLVFCDVDKRTQNTTAELIAEKITEKTKAILIIHFGGIPCEMDPIVELCKKNNLILIEDAACGVASKYKGQALGTIGDMGMWSFDAMKILVCGDGAMVYLKDLEKREWASKYMYFGLESQSGYSNSVDKKWWEFDISQFGHRAIMNDVTASMALCQLEKLPGFIARRREIAKMYDEQLKDIDWLDTPPVLPDYMEHSYYMYHVQLHNDKRDDFAKFLRDNDIYTTYRYYPLHWVKGYNANVSLPNAEWAALHTLCLPIHQSLSNDDVEKIITTIKKFQ